MRPTTRPAFIVALTALLGATMSAGALAADHGGGDGEPVTLSFALTASPETPEAQAMATFAAAVHDISNGNVTIVLPPEPLGKDPVPGHERKLTGAVIAGEFDGTLVGTRTMDQFGVTALQPLQLPFQVDTINEAFAVAADPLAGELLGALSAAGLHGIGLIPLDAVHPVSFGDPFLAPADLAGVTIQHQPSQLSETIFAAYGMVPEDLGWIDYRRGIADGTLGSSEAGFKHAVDFASHGTVTANVTWWVNLFVVAMNSAAYDSLTDTQRAALEGAVVRTRETLAATRRSEVDEARHYCDLGGRVVLVDPAELDAFKTVAQPIVDAVAKDPASTAAQTLLRLDAIRAVVEPAALPEACDGRPATDASPTPSTQVTTLPPVGTWRTTTTTEQFMAVGMDRGQAERNAGVRTLVVEDDTMTLYIGPISDDSPSCQQEMAVNGDTIRLTITESDTCAAGVDIVRWHMEGKDLRMELVGMDPSDPQWLLEEAIVIEAPWERID